ncbi:MAG: response regulator transcription factor [Paludibacteraceae bacterium]
MKIHTAIIEDNYFLIKSVKEKLSFFDDINIIFTATNGLECMDKLGRNHRTDIILMDIEMPKLNGIETTTRVKQKYPQIKIIVLTVFDDDKNIFNAIQGGADGYLLKDASPQALYDAIVQTMKGGAAMTPSIALKTLNLLRSPLTPEIDDTQTKIQFTDRETQVLEQLSKGLPYTAIAKIYSPKIHRKHLSKTASPLQD